MLAQRHWTKTNSVLLGAQRNKEQGQPHHKKQYKQLAGAGCAAAAINAIGRRWHMRLRRRWGQKCLHLVQAPRYETVLRVHYR